MKQIKHLFLEGPVQSGKSTAIQRLLSEAFPAELYQTKGQANPIGGFTSQRLTSETRPPGLSAHSTRGISYDGTVYDCEAFETKLPTVAYRIAPAMSPLSTPLEPCMLDDPAGHGIFRYVDPLGETHKYPQVFDTSAISYVSCAANESKPRVILLDEIGGAELLHTAFRDALYEVLSGDIPCIGVIKLEESAAHMMDTASYDTSVLNLNRQLRKHITKNGGLICPYERDSLTTVDIITDFIKNL